MRATTLSYMGPNFEADTGDLFGTLAGLFGGGANAPNLAAGGGPGKTLGGLGAASIATALGMPQFAPMAASAGSMLGGLAQQGIETLTKPKPPKPRQLSRNERRIIDQGRAKAKQTGNEAFAQEAVLRVQRPAEYKRLRTLGKLPSQAPATPQTCACSSTGEAIASASCDAATTRASAFACARCASDSNAADVESCTALRRAERYRACAA
jgi:hypothetical protein